MGKWFWGMGKWLWRLRELADSDQKKFASISFDIQVSLAIAGIIISIGIYILQESDPTAAKTLTIVEDTYAIVTNLSRTSSLSSSQMKIPQQPTSSLLSQHAPVQQSQNSESASNPKVVIDDPKTTADFRSQIASIAISVRKEGESAGKERLRQLINSLSIALYQDGGDVRAYEDVTKALILNNSARGDYFLRFVREESKDNNMELHITAYEERGKLSNDIVNARVAFSVNWADQPTLSWQGATGNQRSLDAAARDIVKQIIEHLHEGSP